MICIENYDSLPNVKFTRNDALITKKYFVRILGVPVENIISLVDSEATKARSEGYFKNRSLPIWGSFQLDSVNVQEGILGVYNGETTFIHDLIGEVSSILLKNRAKTLIRYEIH
jgi:hypothetical protein